MGQKTEPTSRADRAVIARAKKRRRAIFATLRRATVSDGSACRSNRINGGHSVQETGR